MSVIVSQGQPFNIVFSDRSFGGAQTLVVSVAEDPANPSVPAMTIGATGVTMNLVGTVMLNGAPIGGGSVPDDLTPITLTVEPARTIAVRAVVLESNWDFTFSGPAGVGRTATANSTGEFYADDVLIEAGDKVLFASVDEASSGSSSRRLRGLYECITAGAEGVAAVFRRATTWDQAAETVGATHFTVSEGTTYAGTLWGFDGGADGIVFGSTQIFITHLVASVLSTTTGVWAVHPAGTTISAMHANFAGTVLNNGLPIKGHGLVLRENFSDVPLAFQNDSVGRGSVIGRSRATAATDQLVGYSQLRTILFPSRNLTGTNAAKAVNLMSGKTGADPAAVVNQGSFLLQGAGATLTTLYCQVSPALDDTVVTFEVYQNGGVTSLVKAVAAEEDGIQVFQANVNLDPTLGAITVVAKVTVANTTYDTWVSASVVYDPFGYGN